jgi:POT family proton-dependent oligopeptide transporter
LATITPPYETAAPGHDTRFFGHPKGLSTLFFTEMWERFSYYGMRALLILFMTAPLAGGGLGFDTAKAGAIYGTYVALVYLTSLPGGWIADRFLGQRRAVLYGGVIIMLGHISLAIPSVATFYLGLGCVVTGTGLLKPNVSTMVGELYSREDIRRDSGFSLYYMGINLGAFIAPLICGWFAQSRQFRGILAESGLGAEGSWHWGFAMAALGMFFGLVQYMRGWKYLGSAGLHAAQPDDAEARARQRSRLRLGIFVVALVVAVIAGGSATGIIPITAEWVANAFGVLLLVATVAFFFWMFALAHWTPDERKRLVVVLVLFVAATVFWSVFEQAGSTLNLFAQRNTSTVAFGMAFPPSWFQSMEPFFLVIFSPVFAWLWLRLGKHDPSSPTKFTIGLVCVAASFALLVPASHQAGGAALASPLWLTGTYLLQAFGELCLSPVGLSAMTRLAPARIAGLTMGVWFLATSAGNYLGGRVGGLYEAFSLPQLFGSVALFALAAAAIMALLIRPIRRMLAR